LKGWSRPILLVIAKEKNGHPIFLFTTDLSLSPARVVELYAPRWKIEISFRELKQEGGMADYQVRSKKGITRHVTLCFVAHCILQLLSILDVKERLSINPILRLWYRAKEFSISQTRSIIQQVCIRNLFFQLLLKMGIPYEKYKVISAFNELINGQWSI
jgi:transposase